MHHQTGVLLCTVQLFRHLCDEYRYYDVLLLRVQRAETQWGYNKYSTPSTVQFTVSFISLLLFPLNSFLRKFVFLDIAIIIEHTMLPSDGIVPRNSASIPLTLGPLDS